MRNERVFVYLFVCFFNLFEIELLEQLRNKSPLTIPPPEIEP